MIDEVETRYLGQIMKKETQIIDLEDALNEVMLWINNWSPSFTDDDEWEETLEKVNHALKGNK